MNKRRFGPALFISIILLLPFMPAAGGVSAASDRPAKNDVVIELTWSGEVDLDLHVTGLLDEEERFNAWSFEKQGPGNGPQGEAGPGGGIEEVTISEGDHGPYQVYVHDFSNTDSSRDETFAHSGAKVRVLNGSGPEDVYDVPEAGYGNLWSVCAIDGGSVTPINEMSIEEKPGLVGRDPKSTLIPGDIIFGTQPDTNIPTKWSHVGMYMGDGLVAEAFGTDIPTQLFPISDWEYPEMTYVSYFRVAAADAGVRERAVEFVFNEIEKEAPYDIGFHTKQVNGESWYCTELVWAAYLEASGGKINIEQSPDRLGVYPWEIEHSEEVALVGGHYERFPDRNLLRMAWVGIKRLFQYVLLPAAGRLTVSIFNNVTHPVFIITIFILCISIAIWHHRNSKARGRPGQTPKPGE